MKILSIGLDKRVLDKSSATFKRFKEYIQLVDKFYIVVFGSGKEIRNENLFIYGSGGCNKIFRFLRARKITKRILKDKNLKNWLVTTQDSFFSGFLGYLLKKKFGIKLHVQLHGDFFSSKYFRKESLYTRFLYFLGKFIIKKADGFRVVSQRIKKSLVRLGIDEDKITVIPIYVKVQNPKSKVQSQKLNKFIFLTVGRLVAVKNIELQIRAFAKIVKKYPNVELWIVGEGKEEKKLKLLVKKSNLEDKVKFLGWQDDLERFYRKADVFLLTSNYEGWGLTVIEAANYGLPIIMTDVGCAGEVIENPSTSSGQVRSGIVIPINNQKALEEAMVKLIEDKKLRERLGENAKKAISMLPSKEETLKLYKNSWQKALKN